MKGKEILRAFSEAVSGLVEENARIAVCVETDARHWRTGILINEKHILTVARQAEEGESVGVILSGGENRTARVAGYDAGTELALLRLEEAGTGVPGAIGTGLPRVGDFSLAVAYPSPEGVEARSGIVRCVSAGPEGAGRYFQTDSRMFPGFAGSAVLDADGNLVGITALAENSASGYVIPIQDALDVAEKLSKAGSTKRGYLGIRTMPVELPGSGGGNQETGLVIVKVEGGSPAEAAGLSLGDVLVSLDGKPVTDHRDLIRIISLESGDRAIEAGILRGGEKKAFPVTPRPKAESMSRRPGAMGGRHNSPGGK